MFRTISRWYAPIAVLVAFSFTFSGCASVGGNDYAVSGAQRAYEIEYGVVVSTRPVTINENSETATGLGTVGGGVVGGVLGSLMGSGKGSVLTTLGGAVVGAAAGGLGGHALGRQTGVEVTVRMDSGKTMAFVQGADINFAPGQRVRVAIGSGTVHVSPAQEGYAPAGSQPVYNQQQPLSQ